MRIRILTLALTLAAGAALAQRHKLGTVNAETPEGQLLQQIGQSTDDAKKLALMEEFEAKAPKHEAIGWVYEQMQVAYLKAGQPDKAIQVGDKLVAMDPDHLRAGHAEVAAERRVRRLLGPQIGLLQQRDPPDVGQGGQRVGIEPGGLPPFPVEGRRLAAVGHLLPQLGQDDPVPLGGVHRLEDRIPVPPGGRHQRAILVAARFS